MQSTFRFSNKLGFVNHRMGMIGLSLLQEPHQ
jgi:hypothetical protein